MQSMRTLLSTMCSWLPTHAMLPSLVAKYTGLVSSKRLDRANVVFFFFNNESRLPASPDSHSYSKFPVQDTSTESCLLLIKHETKPNPKKNQKEAALKKTCAATLRELLCPFVAFLCILLLQPSF